MPGLFSRLGSFGKKAWGWARRQVEPIASAIGLGRLVGIEVPEREAWREYRHVINLEETAERIASVPAESYIPHGLYVEARVPSNRPFAYEVTMSGRDLATGRFYRSERRMTFSRELAVEEIMEEAESRFGATGAYPQVAITHLSVTGAFTRPGEGRI